MSTFSNFTLKQEYDRLIAAGDKLSEIDKLIDWKPFRPIMESMYTNRTDKGGRPENDVIMMFKMLVLQQWHGLSDPELERQCIDRISFRKFLGFPKRIPDDTTVWAFRDRIAKLELEEQIWGELQRQLDCRGLEIKKGMIQDATFIVAEPGHSNQDKLRGDEAKTRRSRDGNWSKKGGKSYFGYKLHTIIDKENELIRRFETTVASVHDSQVDLSEEGEVVYRDKGYFGVEAKGFAATMQRAVRGKPLNFRQIMRNDRISVQRMPCERVYAVTKGVFRAGKVMVTTVKRVNLKMMMTAFCFNLHQMRTLKRKKVIA